MNKRSLYTYFMIPANRNIFIKKIDDRLRLEDKYKVQLNEEVDKRHKDILLNWKLKSKEERMLFCQEVLDAPRDDAYKVVAEKKQEINKYISDKKTNIKTKVKKIIEKL